MAQWTQASPGTPSGSSSSASETCNRSSSASREPKGLGGVIRKPSCSSRRTETWPKAVTSPSVARARAAATMSSRTSDLLLAGGGHRASGFVAEVALGTVREVALGHARAPQLVPELRDLRGPADRLPVRSEDEEAPGPDLDAVPRRLEAVQEDGPARAVASGAPLDLDAVVGQDGRRTDHLIRRVQVVGDVVQERPVLVLVVHDGDLVRKVRAREPGA